MATEVAKMVEKCKEKNSDASYPCVEYPYIADLEVKKRKREYYVFVFDNASEERNSFV